VKKPKVNQDLCIGCGSCASISPQVFRLENMKAKVINPQGDTEENIQTAIDACPVQAISWEEEN
jgi:ferredoxin